MTMGERDTGAQQAVGTGNCEKLITLYSILQYKRCRHGNH